MDNTEHIYIFEEMDEFAAVKPGEPFRLFKFGDIYKSGRKRTVSKDKRFKLPDFKPAIKLGSHKEETEAGGFIRSLEYRDDGVYAVPEWTDEGLKALEKGAYRYHSPEVIWEGGYIEDAETGKKIEGPLVIGVALTHTPHLGHSAALYTYQPQELNMGEQLETVQVPLSVWDKFMAMFDKPEPEPQEEPEVPEEYELAMKERDEYKARLEQLDAEKAQAEKFAAVRSEFEKEEYGAAFKAIAEEEGAVEKLANMDEETRAWVLEKFAALSAQAEEANLDEEVGEDNPLPESADGFDAAVQAYAKENKVPYHEAIGIVAKEKPELYQAYMGGK